MRSEIPGPVGKLVAEVESPAAPVGVALVCHPHPAHGGSLRNAIVVRVARALRAVGIATVRFNFRGVEGSDGQYDGTQEIEDAKAVADWLRQRHHGLPLWAAGYSFGSRISAELALGDTGVAHVVLIAFPCALYDPRFLLRLKTPGLLVLGEADSFGNAADLGRAVPELPAGLELIEIPGADHFFRGRTPLVEEAVLRYARAAMERP